MLLRKFMLAIFLSIAYARDQMENSGLYGGHCHRLGQPIHYLPNLCLYRKYLKDQLCSFADNQLVGLSAQISGGRVIGSHRVDMASMMMTMIMMLWMNVVAKLHVRNSLGFSLCETETERRRVDVVVAIAMGWARLAHSSSLTFVEFEFPEDVWGIHSTLFICPQLTQMGCGRVIGSHSVV